MCWFPCKTWHQTVIFRSPPLLTSTATPPVRTILSCFLSGRLVSVLAPQHPCLLQSILHTAARVTGVKHNSDLVTSLLKTPQWLSRPHLTSLYCPSHISLLAAPGAHHRLLHLFFPLPGMFLSHMSMVLSLPTFRSSFQMSPFHHLISLIYFSLVLITDKLCVLLIYPTDCPSLCFGIQV